MLLLLLLLLLLLRKCCCWHCCSSKGLGGTLPRCFAFDDRSLDRLWAAAGSWKQGQWLAAACP